MSTPEKAAISRRFGADHVIVGRDADWISEVEALTHGRGVDFVIDGIGGGRLRDTIACVRVDGTVGSIGQAAGPIPDFSVADFAPRRAIRFARPSVMAFAADPDVYRLAGEEVFAMIQRGISVSPKEAYPLTEAAAALCALENGQGTGAKVLTP